MIDRIDVLAHSCVRIRGSRRIYFDPYLLEEDYNDADAVFLTHDHYDHFSPEDFARAARPDTVVVAPESIRKTLLEAGIDESRILGMEPGCRTEVLGIAVEAVPAYNIGKDFHPRANRWLGYVVDMDGTRCYVAGDTDDTPDARRVRCDVALVPVGGTYTMDPAEAAALVNAIEPACAIPTHYGAIVGNKTDGASFAALVDKGIRVVEKLPY